MTHTITITSLVENPSYAKQLGVPPYYYRYRSCNPNFPNRTQTSVSGFSPADQYQKLKIIQHAVRIPGSLYTANLGPLTVYRKPIVDPSRELYGVCWNQMSDRPVPSVQRATVPTGSFTSMNRRHTSVTSSRPGCQTPGGKGCDIKHNSYDRYLNRIKGKAPMRRGVVPPAFGAPIPFNPAYPVYGGKTLKTNIIDSCVCPQDTIEQQNQRLYDNPMWQPYPATEYGFQVGDYVYAVQTGMTAYTRAIVTSISPEGVYTIQFDNGTIQQVANVDELLVYFPCNCGGEIDSVGFKSGFYVASSTNYGEECVVHI